MTNKDAEKIIHQLHVELCHPEESYKNPSEYFCRYRTNLGYTGDLLVALTLAELALDTRSTTATDADVVMSCAGCKYEHKAGILMPCARCRRRCEDYWRKSDDLDR